MWDKNTIFEKVITSADKYGYSNLQQWKQLLFSIQKCEDQDIFEGLARCFTTTNENNSIRQELAGRLLYELKPKAIFELENILAASLDYFDLSVEHYLFYFVEYLGMEKVTKSIAAIDRKILTESKLRSLQTMEYWLKNYANWCNV